MGYRLDELAPGEVYHIYTRGVEQRTIFRHTADRQRFLALLLHCLPQGPIRSFSTAQKYRQPLNRTDEGKGLVDLLCYCLMSNHLHLLLRENCEGGTSLYLQRLLNSYAKYFNYSQQRSGSLFVNPFKSVLIVGDDHVLHVSRYIHLNPYVAHLVTDVFDYSWSSLSEYTSTEPARICHTALLSSMLGPAAYREFVTNEAGYARSLADLQHLLVDFE